ncbi:hypothetical protein CAL18_12390 [Bordetella genomosp. 7]|uniref:GTA-gp10 family protein n=1 Tax=Bordetella genomosp. 7 TaxID=1416805 RepID=UPI000B9E2FB1|nr:GTA-gp10 family protein [Bordetella genomosp. 7]OZI21719.1 hypothetical protein CAL18_12390 [Bordetella genomosp. 7]
MAAVFQEVTIGWKGVEYRIKPTLALLNRVEQKVSLSALAHSLGTGAPKLTHIASAIAVFLQAAGASVTEDDVYVELIHGDQGAVTSMAHAIVIAAFPENPAKGKEGGPKQRAAKAK